MREEEARLIIGSLLHNRVGQDVWQEERELLVNLMDIADELACLVNNVQKDTDLAEPDPSVPLQSIFNILNGNHQKMHYRPRTISPDGKPNYPTEDAVTLSDSFYRNIRKKLSEHLENVQWTAGYINSLLSLMETELSYIPAYRTADGMADISLYDHARMSAAIVSCLYASRGVQGPWIYYLYHPEKEPEFNDKKLFLFCTMDISGIQEFIYTISSRRTLDALRARSFYIEIIMEHTMDCLLECLGLSRVNVIYSGGGRCYLLIPDMPESAERIDKFKMHITRSFLTNYGTTLYLSLAYIPCSLNMLRDVPEGSYAALFRDLGNQISGKKTHRYSYRDITYLNHTRGRKKGFEECFICHTRAALDESGLCLLCRQLERLSRDIRDKKYYAVMPMPDQGRDGLPLPGGSVMTATDRRELKRQILKNPSVLHIYSKNLASAGRSITTNLWTGDYSAGDDLKMFAEISKGGLRLGALRMDVDNLGQTFVSGFHDPADHNRYVTLSRTAALSRQISLFFKYHINYLLRNGKYDITGRSKKIKRRKISIIYCGGDDMFLIGAWDDIIEFAIDMNRALRTYSQGTLTLSGGIHIYPYESQRTIALVAEETGEMEENSKSLPGKNSVTLLEDGNSHPIPGTDRPISNGTFPWDEFERNVIEEKFQTLYTFFEDSDQQKENALFLYRCLKSVLESGGKIRFPQFVSLLSELESFQKGESVAAYDFAVLLYRWIRSEKDRRELKTALTLYSFLQTERGKEPLRERKQEKQHENIQKQEDQPCLQKSGSQET